MGISMRGHQSSFFAPKSGLRTVSLLLIACCLYGNLWTLYSRSVASANPISTTSQSAVASTEKQIETQANESTAASAGSISLSSIATTAAASSTIGCTVAVPYVSPSQLDVLNLPEGLTVVVDTPYTYAVKATSLSGLRTAVTTCAARVQVAGDFHAITARQINWTYTLSATADEGCTLKDIRVGLHVAQFLPTLSNEARLDASDLAAWNKYETSLHLHEAGHVAIARRYAGELTDKLQAMHTLSCDQLKTQAGLTINSILTTLNTEDTLYDTETNHGATQGAVL